MHVLAGISKRMLFDSEFFYIPERTEIKCPMKDANGSVVATAATTCAHIGCSRQL